MRNKRCAKPWKVPTHIPCTLPSTVCSTRARISAAALLVKVTARMLCGDACSTFINQAIRCTKTRVLPLPAPARTNIFCKGAATTSRCLSFNESSNSETSIER